LGAPDDYAGDTVKSKGEAVVSANAMMNRAAILAMWRKMVRNTCQAAVCLVRSDLSSGKLTRNNCFNSRLPRETTLPRT